METKTAIDELNQASQQLSSRVERVANERLAAAQESARALVKMYEAQYQAGLDLLKKSTETLKGLTEGDLPAKTRRLVEAALENARANADAWLEFAQESLGKVRRVVRAAIQSEQAA
jgi:ribosomal protein L22